MRPCQACRLRRVKCNRSRGDALPCDACVRKKIQCLEQTKRTVKLTRNTTGKRVEEARQLFGTLDGALSASPDTHANVSAYEDGAATAGPAASGSKAPSPRPYHHHHHHHHHQQHQDIEALPSSSRLSGQNLPISIGELATLVQDYLEHCILPDHVNAPLKAFNERLESAGWNLSNMSAVDHCLSLATAAGAALVASNIPIQLSLLPDSQKAMLRNATAQQLCDCALRIAERSAFFTSPTKDVIDALAILGAMLADLDDSLPSVYATISACLAQCNWFYARRGRSFENFALWTGLARMGMICIKQRRYCFDSPKVLADLLGENEKEILMGGYSNLELFPAEAGILVAAARTIRSLYVFATEFCEETDPATLETRVRRMLAQQEIVTHWTDSITPANRMLFGHAFGVALVDCFIVHESYDILIKAGVSAGDVHQKVLSISRSTFNWLKMMDDLMKRTNCKLPPSVSIGGLRHMLAAVCQMAVEANADPIGKQEDRQWTASFFKAMADSYPDFQVLSEQWLLQSAPAVEEPVWHTLPPSYAVNGFVQSWYPNMPGFYGGDMLVS